MSKHQRPRQTAGASQAERQAHAYDNPVVKPSVPSPLDDTIQITSLQEPNFASTNTIKPQMASLTIDDNRAENSLQIPPKPIIYFKEEASDLWPHASPYTSVLHPSFHLRENPFQYLPFMFGTKTKDPTDDSPTVDIYFPKPQLTNYLKMRNIQRDRGMSVISRKKSGVLHNEPNAKEIETAIQQVSSQPINEDIFYTEESDKTSNYSTLPSEDISRMSITAMAERAINQFRKCLCCFCLCCPLKKVERKKSTGKANKISKPIKLDPGSHTLTTTRLSSEIGNNPLQSCKDSKASKSSLLSVQNAETATSTNTSGTD